MRTPKTIAEIIKEHSERLRCFHCGTDEEKIGHILDDYHNDAVRAMSDTKHFRDDLLTYLRAMALICDMTASASTHREKNARLRGMVELIESAIGKLRETSFDFSLAYRGMTPDIFRSDYPTRQFVDRIHELEDELKQLTGKETAAPIQPVEPLPAAEPPW